MELKPCISPGSHHKGVSSEWCFGAASQSENWQSFVTTHKICQGHSFTCFQNASPPIFFLSQLSFSAWLSHHMPDWQVAGAQKISQSFYLLFSFLVLILNYLSHLWALLLFVLLRESPSYIYAHGSLMGKKLSSNSLSPSKYDLLGIETHRVFNHCMHALSLIPIILKQIPWLRIVISIPLTILLNATSPLPSLALNMTLSQE